jgi:HNH endonuclease
MRYLSEKTRFQVITRALNCCEYCLIPELFSAATFHIDHIRSLKHDGKNILDNLAYACPHCNQNKGTDIATFLSEDSELIIRLFNPRKDLWLEHFEVNRGQILGISDIGIATTRLLDFNQPERMILRNELLILGLYP